MKNRTAETTWNSMSATQIFSWAPPRTLCVHPSLGTAALRKYEFHFSTTFGDTLRLRVVERTQETLPDGPFEQRADSLKNCISNGRPLWTEVRANPCKSKSEDSSSDPHSQRLPPMSRHIHQTSLAFHYMTCLVLRLWFRLTQWDWFVCSSMVMLV